MSDQTIEDRARVEGVKMDEMFAAPPSDGFCHAGDPESYADWLLEFASAEVKRERRECVEAFAMFWCGQCADSNVPATRHVTPAPCRWYHDREERGLSECEADEMREWAHQREKENR